MMKQLSKLLSKRITKLQRKNNLNNNKMTLSEFAARTGVAVSLGEFTLIRAGYYASDYDKDEYCALWCKLFPNRVEDAKKAKMRAKRVNRLMRTMLHDKKWHGKKNLLKEASLVLTGEERADIEAVGINLEKTDEYGIITAKTLREIKEEVFAIADEIL